MQKIIKEIFTLPEALIIRNLPGRIGCRLRLVYWRCLSKGSFTAHLGQGCIVLNSRKIITGENVSCQHNCIFDAAGSGYIKIGRDFDSKHNCYFDASNNGFIQIGDSVSIHANVTISAAFQGKIVLGNSVLIGPNVVIRASNHRYQRKDIPIAKQGHIPGIIIIGDDAWIGANAVILPDVAIGKGAVVGAGAVVTKDIPEYALAGGVPAAVIKADCRT